MEKFYVVGKVNMRSKELEFVHDIINDKPVKTISLDYSFVDFVAKKFDKLSDARAFKKKVNAAGDIVNCDFSVFLIKRGYKLGTYQFIAKEV